MFDPKNFDLGEEIKKVSSITGEQRAGHLKFVRSYVRTKAGDTGIRMVEDEISRHGFVMPDIPQLKDLDWISSVFPTVYMLGAAKALRWDKNDIYEMGRQIFAFGHPARFFIKYFLSPERTFRIAAKKWQQSYSFGTMEIIDTDIKRKRVVFRLIDFKKHPITCLYLQGIFTKIVEMATGSDKTSITETKCVFRGDPYHEYSISWE